MHKSFSGHVFLYLCGKYLGVECQCHMVGIGLILEETPKLLFKVVVPVTFPLPVSEWSLMSVPVIHTLATALYAQSF